MLTTRPESLRDLARECRAVSPTIEQVHAIVEPVRRGCEVVAPALGRNPKTLEALCAVAAYSCAEALLDEHVLAQIVGGWCCGRTHFWVEVYRTRRAPLIVDLTATQFLPTFPSVMILDGRDPRRKHYGEPWVVGAEEARPRMLPHDLVVLDTLGPRWWDRCRTPMNAGRITPARHGG